MGGVTATCPICGAAYRQMHDGDMWFTCGTERTFSGQLLQTRDCTEAAVAKAKRELESKIVTLECDVEIQKRRADAAEDVLRSLASWLSVGGYNAPTVNAEDFEKRIRWGVDMLLAPHLESFGIVAAAKALDALPNVENRCGEWNDVRSAIKALTDAVGIQRHAQMKREQAGGSLEEWCARTGRDPSEFTNTTIPRTP
jgi:hypothetical protein